MLHSNDEDLRPTSLERRAPPPNFACGETIDADGPEAFAVIDKMGLEGIVSKRLGSRYKSGDTSDWLKIKTFVTESLDLIGTARDERRGVAVSLWLTATPFAVPQRLRCRRKSRYLLALRGATRGPSAAIPGIEREATWLQRGVRVRVKHLRGD